MCAKSYKHLRKLYIECYQELDVSGSSGGVLIGESILLHLASMQCHNIRSIDLSWTNVGDVGMQTIIDCADRYLILFA